MFLPIQLDALLKHEDWETLGTMVYSMIILYTKT